MGEQSGRQSSGEWSRAVQQVELTCPFLPCFPLVLSVFQQHMDALGEDGTRIGSRQGRADAALPQLQCLEGDEVKNSLKSSLLKCTAFTQGVN